MHQLFPKNIEHSKKIFENFAMQAMFFKFEPLE